MKKPKLNFKTLFLFLGINIVILFAVLYFISGRPELVGISRMELAAKTDSALHVRFHLILRNPNIFSIGGEGIVMEVYNKDQVIATGKFDKINIASKDVDTVSLVVDMNTDVLMKQFGDKIDTGMTASIRLKGTFSPLFFVSEINYESGLPKEDVQQLLVQTFFSQSNLRFDSLRYTNASGYQSELAFNTVLSNSFKFDFTVNSLEADIYPSAGSETVLGTWKLSKPVQLKPSKPVVLPTNLLVHHFSLMKAGLEKNGKNLNSAYIQGHVVVDLNGRAFTVPFGLPVTVDISNLKVIPKVKNQ